MPRSSRRCSARRAEPQATSARAGLAPALVLAPLSGLASAVTYGAGDFLAGVASRRASVAVVALGSQLVGLALLPLLALALGEAMPDARGWAWAFVAGLSAFVGIGGLYAAFAMGRMGVAAPITGVLAAAVPVAYAWTTGGAPSGLAVAGIALALVGIGLVSGPKAERPPPRVLLLAVLSGLGFAGFLLLIGISEGDAVVWPLVGARLGTGGAFLIVVLVTRPTLRGAPLLLVLATGVLVAAGDATYLLAARLGRLDVAVVLSSLYPAFTVALARLVLKERLTRMQSAGAALMLAAIPMIAMAS